MKTTNTNIALDPKTNNKIQTMSKGFYNKLVKEIDLAHKKRSLKQMVWIP